jgi:dihydroorotase/N-acyl-D-amino-acid deacylase
MRLAILLLCARAAIAQPYDVVFGGGRVVDGTGAPWFRADVGVRAGKIGAIGDLHAARAKRRIELSDQMIAPGFIDLLGQSEWTALVDNRVESKIRMGITTELSGEGISPAPIEDGILGEMKPFLDKYHLVVDWHDLDGYFKRLERARPAINLGLFIGAATLRMMFVGKEDVAATDEQLQKMERALATGMAEGAFGVSSALIYAPGSYARTAELIALAKVAARYGGIYASHIRDEGEGELGALDEAFTIAREARIPVEIWHLKAAGKPMWGKMPQIIARIEAARSAGLDVSADAYPYVAAFNNLDSNLPQWAEAGGADKLLERLKDPAQRAKIKDQMLHTRTQYRDVGPENILLAQCVNPQLRKYMGRRLPEVAREMGKSNEDALIDLVIADRANVQNILFMMSEDDVQTAWRTSWLAFDTDYSGQATDGPLKDDLAHPRGFGGAARLIGHYARDLHLFSIEEAVRRMTSLPARRVGLSDRGLVRPAMAADLVVFDPARVRDLATFEKPNQYAEGFSYVMVNGELVLDGGKLTSARPGRALRHRQ